jgi:predicted ATPase/DNA-binding XRE family transcriptional regulator
VPYHQQDLRGGHRPASAREPFATALRRLRARSGLTQQELAQRAGLSSKAISALERGERRRPYIHTVRAIAGALGLDREEHVALIAGLTQREHSAQLPVPASSLIGRGAEVAAVAELVVSGRSRLVTLTGPGGVGKTRLAVAAAEQVASEFPDGVAFISLAALDGTGQVLPTIASGLALRAMGERSLADVLLDYLRRRRTLLVLDNLEHLPSAATAVAAILAAGVQPRILATSRAPLRVQGEQVHVVPPLAAWAATELFLDRVDLAMLDDAGADPAVAAEICRRLDGLPLPIEIAAARTRILSPAALLTRLDQALVILTGGPRDLPERQQTLRRTIDWSHDLLTPAEQSLFRRLAVFENGWTLAAAAAVGRVDEAAALDLHTALADSSLLTHEAGAEEPRFGMLETIRAYAIDRLESSGEAAAARADHAAHYRRLALTAAHELLGPAQAHWLERVDLDHDNLRVALAWFLESGLLDEVARICYSLWAFWSIRGHLREGTTWVDRALEQPGRLSALARARLLFVGAGMIYLRGRYDDASTMLEEGAGLARGAGDQQTLASILAMWCFVAIYQRDLERGSAIAEEAEALGRATGNLYAAAMARIAKGNLAMSRSDLAAADEILRGAAAEIRELGAPLHLTVALNIHGRAALLQGDYARVEALMPEAIEILGQQQNTWAMMLALTNLADAAALQADAARAARLFGAVDALGQRTGASIFPVYRDLSDRCREAAATAIGREAFEALRRQGMELRREEVVALATGAEADP